MDIELTDEYIQRKEACREFFYIAKNTLNGFENQKAIVKRTMRLWFDNLPFSYIEEIWDTVLEEEYGLK